MNRKEAMSIVLAEAFAENGLVMFAHNGDDPGFERLERLISALRFLADELASESKLDRILVSALFAFATQVPEEYQCGLSPTSDSRSSLLEQLIELQTAVMELIECWQNSPSEEELSAYTIDDSPLLESDSEPPDEVFKGYRVGDITYCVVSKSEEFFPVKVIRLGFNVIEVEPLSSDICRSVCETFLEERLSRCFHSPSLPARARFGGFDERPVNASRQSGPELRLLPTHYSTTTNQAIRQRHQADPQDWPLPTGAVFERWFKKATD